MGSIVGSPWFWLVLGLLALTAGALALVRSRLRRLDHLLEEVYRGNRQLGECVVAGTTVPADSYMAYDTAAFAYNVCRELPLSRLIRASAAPVPLSYHLGVLPMAPNPKVEETPGQATADLDSPAVAAWQGSADRPSASAGPAVG